MSVTKAQLVGGVGISTAQNVVVGSAVTINSTGIDVTGIVTATSFSGDGSNLTNTGSTLSAASGSQRVVVTTQTSGTMTASATDGDLTYDANSDTLNTANLHVTGISTLGTTNGIGKVTIGIGTTALLVEGNARVTGILTVGSSSITFDGVNNTITVGSGVTISASTGLTGSGANLTSLNASNLASGTVPDARFPATLPAASGANLTSLNASNVSSGTLAIARGGTNSTATATAGGAAYGTGTAFAFTSAGTSGQVLTSNGTSAPTWADASGGAWEFISSVTANNSASVAFTSGIDSTYDTYVIIGVDILPATNGVGFRSRISTNGGSSYLTSGYDDPEDNQSYTGAYFGSHLVLSGDRSGMGNNSSYSGGLTMYLYNPSSSKYKQMSSRLSFTNNNGGPQLADLYSGNSNTTAYNAIQFYMTSGNIASGTFRLYGIKNS